jgi:putative SbcD/Mre11-related phosphoesterase
MDLEERFGFQSGCLFIRDSGICAASDLHIGLEDELLRQGLAFPLQEERLLLERLEGGLKKFKPTIFVLAGDIVHSFNRIDRKVIEKLDSVMRLLEKQCRVILLRGSHDTMLSTLPKEVLDRYDLGEFTFAHGHAALEGHKNLIIGHEHPVIQIEMERLPCFLYGREVVKGKDLIMLPAFNPLCQGVTINHVEGRDFMSPLLKRVDTGELAPVVEVQGEVLVFPRMTKLRRHID